ncbi:hypothetical protein KCU83_g525, partial [Aureobasidium melanogenum]
MQTAVSAETCLQLQQSHAHQPVSEGVPRPTPCGKGEGSRERLRGTSREDTEADNVEVSISTVYISQLKPSQCRRLVVALRQYSEIYAALKGWLGSYLRCLDLLPNLDDVSPLCHDPLFEDSRRLTYIDERSKVDIRWISRAYALKTSDGLASEVGIHFNSNGDNGVSPAMEHDSTIEGFGTLHEGYSAAPPSITNCSRHSISGDATRRILSEENIDKSGHKTAEGYQRRAHRLYQSEGHNRLVAWLNRRRRRLSAQSKLHQQLTVLESHHNEEFSITGRLSCQFLVSHRSSVGT